MCAAVVELVGGMIAAVALVLAAVGAGRYSVDHAVTGRRRAEVRV